MMRAVQWRELIVDGYDRLPELMEEVLAGFRATDLDWQPGGAGNSLGWTAWHLTRVQDSQIADLMGDEQLWVRDAWCRRFKRPGDPDDTGYGHTAEQVRGFRSPSARIQLDYLRAVVNRSKRYLASLRPTDLGRKLDEPWSRPRPTVAVRVVSILADCHHHAGEASYIRGLLKVRSKRGRRPAHPGSTGKSVMPRP